jgi:type II secretory pathway pseudopilin PulG
MRRALGLVVLLVLGVAGAPAAAAKTGVIRGTVVNRSTDERVTGIEVTLTTAQTGSDPETTTVTTDDRGSYEFRDLPTGDDRFYAIDAVFENGLFSGDAITIPADTEQQPVIRSTLGVWPTTTDPSVILLRRDDLFVVQGEEATVNVIESVTVLNQGTEAYIGRGGDDGGDERATSLGFALPPGVDEASVRIVDADIDLPELRPTEFGFGTTAAIPPGETHVTYSYSVAGSGGSYDLSRSVLYPTVSFSVFASDPLDMSSNRLTPNGEVSIEGQTYDRYTATDGLDGGDPVQLLALAQAGVQAGLLAGMAGALALVIVLGLIPFLRLRRKRGGEGETKGDADDGPGDREGIVRAMAELDVAHERGEVPDDEWAARRARLRDELLKKDAGAG